MEIDIDELKSEQPLFSKRMQMETEYYKWCKKHGVQDRPMNVITWILNHYYLIDKET